MPLPFHLMQGTDANQLHRALGITGHRPGAKDGQIRSAMDHPHLGPIGRVGFRHDPLAVERGNGDHERRVADFLPQHVDVAMQIGTMGREAVRDAGQLADHPGHRGGMAREVGVHVIDLLPLHLLGELHRLGKRGEKAEQIPRAPPVRDDPLGQHAQVVPRGSPETAEVGGEYRPGKEPAEVSPGEIGAGVFVHPPRPLPPERIHLDRRPQPLERLHFI
jgi:hypothetical protein